MGKYACLAEAGCVRVVAPLDPHNKLQISRISNKEAGEAGTRMRFSFTHTQDAGVGEIVLEEVPGPTHVGRYVGPRPHPMTQQAMHEDDVDVSSRDVILREDQKTEVCHVLMSTGRGVLYALY